MGFFSRIFRTNPGPVRPSAKADCRTSDWPFDQPPNAAAITTRQVLEKAEEIHAVVHYSDDHSWGFLCGTTDAAEDGRVIVMQEAVQLDDTLRSIADLPPGWKAWREHRGSPWIKEENDEGNAPSP